MSTINVKIISPEMILGNNLSIVIDNMHYLFVFVMFDYSI